MPHMARFILNPFLAYNIRGPIRFEKYTTTKNGRAKNRFRMAALVESDRYGPGHCLEYRQIDNREGVLDVVPKKFRPPKDKVPPPQILGPDIPDEERPPDNLWQPGPDKANPHHVSPPNYKAECKAWKAADEAYQQLPTDIRDQWRSIITEPGTSTYDWFMRQAIPHLLRGWPAPALPTAYIRWKLHALTPRIPFNISDPAPPYECQPPPECRTWGLEYVIAHSVKMALGMCPNPLKRYATFFQLNVNTGYPTTPNAHWSAYRVYSHEPQYTLLYTETWKRYDLAHPNPIWTAARPWYGGIEYWPCKRLPSGLIYPSKIPDPAKKVIVKYIDSRHPWKTWPMHFPSTKNDPRPPNAAYYAWLQLVKAYGEAEYP